MKVRLSKLAGCAGLCLFTVVTYADWLPGDLHKMHYPQTPDPNGWDIKVDGLNIVHDDFRCTQTGPITHIHFWGSFRGDIVPPEPYLNNIYLTIHSDIPDPDGPGPAYSTPGALLWDYSTSNYDPGLVTVREEPEGLQGWYDPVPVDPLVIPDDHLRFFQFNVKIVSDMQFQQTEDTIYWLGIHAVSPMGFDFGWKTSLEHFNDDAVADDLDGGWIELRDPASADIPPPSLDMAFVIVPEPSSTALAMGLLALGALFLGRRFTGRD